MSFVRTFSAAAALIAGLALAQDAEDDRPYRPTIDSFLMQGTGCPIGAAGVFSGVVEGTPLFKFEEFNLDLANVGKADPETGEPTETVDKFCLEQIKMGNSPPGYQVRINSVHIYGPAALEEGSVLGTLVQVRLGGEPAGEGELYFDPGDLEDGQFDAKVPITGDIWSACVAEDGLVPDIHIISTLALWREGSETSKGTVGAEGGDIDNAIAVHFSSDWRKCE